jgi:hypothetical protein
MNDLLADDEIGGRERAVRFPGFHDDRLNLSWLQKTAVFPVGIAVFFASRGRKSAALRIRGRNGNVEQMTAPGTCGCDGDEGGNGESCQLNRLGANLVAIGY